MNTLAQTLLQLNEITPQSIAVRLLFNQKPERSITYSRLIHGSAGYATALNNSGIHPGEVVVLILQHGEELLYAFFGAVLHGSIPAIMPFLTEKLSPEQYRHSLTSLFEITTPAAVVTYPEFLSEVQLAIKPGGSVRTVLASSQIMPQSEFYSPTFASGINLSPENIALLQHSSGTTGLQKGVALSHKAVFNQLDSYTRALNLNSSDVIVSWLPLYHDMGLIAGFLLPILSRVPLVLLSPFDWVRAPHKLLHAVTNYKGTLSWLPNFAYNFCAQKIRSRDLEGIDLSTWRAVSNCSEPMYWKSHQMFLDRFLPYGFRTSALTTCYAMAENVFAVSQGGIDEPIKVDRISQHGLLVDRTAVPPLTNEDMVSMLSAGRPICNTQVRILNQHHTEIADRQLGEIAISSDCMLTGYYNRPDLSSKSFHDGWYLTGDLGYIAQGEVYITGRKKDLIIVGGKNIYPQDLENLAIEVKGVHPGRVVAFGVPNEATGTEDVVIIAEVDTAENEVVEGDLESSSEIDRISDEIRTRVTRGSDIALRLVKLVKRGWLIKTSSGKIARSANRERYLTESMDGFTE
jgi:acyl-CoA synthetase (AMP-forming)/AMP-acid ligase II